jgi:hypothetical protein
MARSNEPSFLYADGTRNSIVPYVRMLLKKIRLATGEDGRGVWIDVIRTCITRELKLYGGRGDRSIELS